MIKRALCKLFGHKWSTEEWEIGARGGTFERYCQCPRCGRISFEKDWKLEVSN